MIDEKKLIEKIERMRHIVGKYSPDVAYACENLLCELKDYINDQPQVGGWTPVTESLPEKTNDERYPISLVTLSNGDVCLGVYRHDDKKWWTRMSEGETVYSTAYKVTAWQPLPEPYKESEEE